MAPQVPSIQSFFQLEVPSPTTHRRFTFSEVDNSLHPALHEWQARTAYDEVDIGSLVPGPGCVAVTGRVANFFDQTMNSKMPRAAKGCLKLIVKDDTGAFAVKLWYAKVDYEIRLGHLVSIWTPHISNAESGSPTLQGAPLVTSIFPERDNSCYFLVQEESDEGVLCKTPLGYRDGKQLDGLMTLKSCINGGHEVSGVKVLVCVKSIGGRKKFTTKKGNETEKTDVNIFDDTDEATLTLWGRTAASATFWKPSYTVLLITNPSFKRDRRPTLSLSQSTHVDVDPCMTDAYWLRGHAQRLIKREHVNQPFPEGVFDIQEAAESETRILFTLADIDEFARAAPTGMAMASNHKISPIEKPCRKLHRLPKPNDNRTKYLHPLPTQHAPLHRMASSPSLPPSSPPNRPSSYTNTHPAAASPSSPTPSPQNANNAKPTSPSASTPV
ncbi:hypothetical protein N7G274_009077 [Stereocaulon virgatum]|uniref:Uncharacterized protein n=1 Tax=Stereocaulon virgatum TaxID=373712 RepID=A0ABR3ZZ95_9LECA